MSPQIDQSIWLVEPGDGFSIAFAGSSILEFAMNVDCQRVPLSYERCCQLVYKQGELVPIIDLSLPSEATTQAYYAVLFLHANESVEQRLIGLHLITPPKKVQLQNSDFDGFDPDQCGHWKSAAISGYLHHGQHIPLIDPRSMRSDHFIDELRQMA